MMQALSAHTASDFFLRKVSFVPRPIGPNYMLEHWMLGYRNTDLDLLNLTHCRKVLSQRLI